MNVHRPMTTNDVLQGNLDSLFKYCSDDDVILNPNKLKAIIFRLFKTMCTVNDINLERVESIKDFSTIFKNKLNFNEHIIELLKIHENAWILGKNLQGNEINLDT